MTKTQRNYIVKALKRILAFAKDSREWPYFRISKFETEQIGINILKQQRDPAGVYCFIKGLPCHHDSNIYGENRPYVWEIRLKPGCRVLNLSQVSWKTAIEWLRKAGITNEDQFLNTFENNDSDMQNLLYDRNDNEIDANSLKAWIKTSLLGTTTVKSYHQHLWFRVLRNKIADSQNFAKFFITLGYDALLDDGKTHPGFFLDYEPQLVVLKRSAIDVRFMNQDSHTYLESLRKHGVKANRRNHY